MKKILVVENRKARLVEAKKFESEATLQTYLEQFPSLLPVWEVDEEAAPLLTIGREVGVPSGAVDLLFTDTNGILTVVETKLARNPEVRREVIGQVIEYASFLSTWDADDVERQANDYLHSERATEDYHDLNVYEALSKVAGDEVPADVFRERIDDNLKRGRIRLVIVVDEIAEPLRSTVTFLNSFSTFDVLVLQLADFEESAARHIFIPSLFGYSRPTRVESRRKVWDERSLFADAEEKRTPDEVRVIRGLYDLAVSTGRAQFGTGTTGGSFTYRVSADGKQWVSLITVYNNFGVQFGFGQLLYLNAPSETLLHFRTLANSIPGLDIPEDAVALHKYPSIGFGPLVGGNAFDRFKEALLWLREQVLKLGISQGDEAGE